MKIGFLIDSSTEDDNRLQNMHLSVWSTISARISCIAVELSRKRRSFGWSRFEGKRRKIWLPIRTKRRVWSYQRSDLEEPGLSLFFNFLFSDSIFFLIISKFGVVAVKRALTLISVSTLRFFCVCKLSMSLVENNQGWFLSV